MSGLLRTVPVLLLFIVGPLAPGAAAESDDSVTLYGFTVGPGAVRLSWATVTESEDLTYSLLREAESGETYIVDLPEGTTTYLDKGLQVGTYVYSLVAHSPNGSFDSNPFPVTTYPYCMPTVYKGAPWVSWSGDCYCPPPPPEPTPGVPTC